MVTNLAVVATIAKTATTAGAGAVAINWGIVISVISVSVAAMVAMIKIFGPKKQVADEELRKSDYVKDIERRAKEAKVKIEELKDIINKNSTEIEKLKIESGHNTKSVEELKQDNRELVQRLDDLLKQILDWVNN